MVKKQTKTAKKSKPKTKKVSKNKNIKTSKVRKAVIKSQPAKLLTSNINKDIKEVKKEVKQAERWMIQRRRFFIKLLCVVGMILILLILSKILLQQAA